VLGLPAPPDVVVVIPKYEPCIRGPWRLAGVKYCRVIRRYDALEIRKAAQRTGLRMFPDPQYNAFMPLLERQKAVFVCDPRDSLSAIVRAPSSRLESLVVDITCKLRDMGVSVKDLGVTGTLALGMELDEVSDIDLVAYGARTARQLVESFHLIGGREVVRGVEWVKLKPYLSLGWRRRIVAGIQISWIGAPEEVGEHCKPLHDWRHLDPPLYVRTETLTIPPGQEGALLYPPCVETSEGLYVVSYEYNTALHLYRGGKVRIRGIASGNTIYLGTLEEPGFIELLG
jgi:hypothetical protein